MPEYGLVSSRNIHRFGNGPNNECCLPQDMEGCALTSSADLDKSIVK